MKGSPAEIPLSGAVSPAAMRRVHKRLTGSIRNVRPTDTRLIHDPIDNLAYSLDLGSNLAALHRRVLSGAYAPSQPATVRVAKRNRLRRPVVFCGLEDGLVLGSLVAAIRPALEDALPDWVSYGGRSRRDAPPSEDPYEGWFLAFLRHHARADRIQSNDDDLIVSSDIANFFPSVNLDLLRDKIQRLGLLDSTATNLLLRLLHEFGGAHSFDPFALRGLPQEPDDNSRLLASYLLVDVDEEFRDLGESDRFGRFSDDMIFSATDRQGAAGIIARLQDSLERLGLAVNSSKTSVLSKQDFASTYLPDANEFLDSVTDDKLKVLTQTEQTEFERNTRSFLRSRREGEWDRVLRRFYSVARRFNSPVLSRYAWRHLDAYPESARHILEYMQALRPTMSTVSKLFEVAMSDGAHYEDVQILCYETLLHLPVGNQSSIRRFIVQNAKDHMTGRGCDAASPYSASLCLLAIYKYGYVDDFAVIEDVLSSDDCPPEVAKQGYVLLRSTGRAGELARSLPPRYNDTDLWRLAHFFEELEGTPSKVLAIAKSWMRPKKSTWPDRQFLRARSLPLFQAFFRSAPESKVFAAVLEQTKRSLTAVKDQRLRDGLSLARLREMEG